MAFPPIRACLVCEDVRIEQKGTATLVGLYGVAPDVEIRVPRFDRPVDRLAFFLSTYGESDGMTHVVSLEARASDGSVVVPRAEALPAEEAPPAGTPFRLAVIFTSWQVMLPGPGRYQIVVEVDGKPHFQTTFNARAATE